MFPEFQVGCMPGWRRTAPALGQIELEPYMGSRLNLESVACGVLTAELSNAGAPQRPPFVRRQSSTSFLLPQRVSLSFAACLGSCRSGLERALPAVARRIICQEY